LNEGILESALTQVPRLLGLHIIGCPRVDYTTVLRCSAHTPLLESLSFTAFGNDSARPLTSLPRVTNLRHLSCDCRPTLMSTASATINGSLLTRLLADVLLPSSPPLRSLSIRLNDRQLCIPEVWVEGMVNAFGGTMRRLSLGDCAVTTASIRKICQKCVSLETLEVPVPVDGTRLFALALRPSSTLHTLIDLTDAHATHNPKVVLTRDNIKYIMTTVKTLRKIVCDGRIWTGHDTTSLYQELQLSLEKKRLLHSPHWFMPPELD